MELLTEQIKNDIKSYFSLTNKAKVEIKKESKTLSFPSDSLLHYLLSAITTTEPTC